MKFAKLYWDITEQPCEFPSIVRDLYFKESIKINSSYYELALIGIISASLIAFFLNFFIY